MDRRQYGFEGATPTVDEDARVSREATLVGDVTVERDASVWPGVVLRGDVGPVSVGHEAHVGDNATVHASALEARVMVGHGAVVNESRVETGALVGFNATVTDSTIGERSIVAAGTVVPSGYDVPASSFVRGSPATVTPLAETAVDPDAVFEAYESGDYTDLAARHDDLFA